jgi:hypothetical protein
VSFGTSVVIASGASDIQVAHQMRHCKIETIKNIYGPCSPGIGPRSSTRSPRQSAGPRGVWPTSCQRGYRVSACGQFGPVSRPISIARLGSLQIPATAPAPHPRYSEASGDTSAHIRRIRHLGVGGVRVDVGLCEDCSRHADDPRLGDSAAWPSSARAQWARYRCHEAPGRT